MWKITRGERISRALNFIFITEKSPQKIILNKENKLMSKPTGKLRCVVCVTCFGRFFFVILINLLASLICRLQNLYFFSASIVFVDWLRLVKISSFKYRFNFTDGFWLNFECFEVFVMFDEIRKLGHEIIM